KLAKQEAVLLKQAKLKDSSKILRSKTRALIAPWTITTIPARLSFVIREAQKRQRQKVVSPQE
ncbi:MAG: hypothetical protein LBT79_08155, partial [Elusimicrobiota bacterium]|nr:hypothetical protein [Elusimicrobiota bacterium]